MQIICYKQGLKTALTETVQYARNRIPFQELTHRVLSNKLTLFMENHILSRVSEIRSCTSGSFGLVRVVTFSKTMHKSSYVFVSHSLPRERKKEKLHVITSNITC